MPTNLFPTSEDGPYDKSPVQLKVKPGVREQLKSIVNWQAKVRLLIDELIEMEKGTKVL